MIRKILLLSITATLLVFCGVESGLQAQPAEFLLGFGAESLDRSVRLLGEGADRELCERDCRETYPAWEARSPEANAYAACIENCERQFWSSFDRKTKKLEKEKRVTSWDRFFLRQAIAASVGLHYSTVSRIVQGERETARNKS